MRRLDRHVHGKSDRFSRTPGLISVGKESAQNEPRAFGPEPEVSSLTGPDVNFHTAARLVAPSDDRLAGVVRSLFGNGARDVLLVPHAEDPGVFPAAPLADGPADNGHFPAPDTLDTDAERLRLTAVRSLIKIRQQRIGALGHRHGFGRFILSVLRVSEDA